MTKPANGRGEANKSDSAEEPANDTFSEFVSALTTLERFSDMHQRMNKIFGNSSDAAPAPSRRRRRPARQASVIEEFDDDEYGDEELEEDDPRYWQQQARLAEKRRQRDEVTFRKEKRRFMYFMVFLQLAISGIMQLTFQWDYTMQLLDQNLMPAVRSFGVAEYEKNFERWTAVSEACEQCEDRKREIDEKLADKELDDKERSKLRDELFDVSSQIQTLNDSVSC